MFRLVVLDKVSILEQLRLEEALLRASHENWCLINTDAADAIVMGISGKPEQLIDLKKVAEKNVPIIKRFSGGGTVYIDAQTVFVTWICSASALNLPMQPQSILKWSEGVYKPLFQGFCLKENDYVFGEKKFGGNAQYIQKNRFLLHTSFLWDYSREKMQYLLLPEKRPQYRKGRSHDDFLCNLRPYYPSKDLLIHALTSHIQSTLSAELTEAAQAHRYLLYPHRTSTMQV